MAGTDITYVDNSIDGQVDTQGNLIVLTGSDAVNNALTQWLTSCPNDFIRSSMGGLIVQHLDKLVDADSARAIQTDIITGLQTEFTPAITVNYVSVIPDLANDQWVIEISGYCPSLKALVQYNQPYRRLM